MESAPAGRRLVLDLAAPVAGDFNVLLELVPHAALPALVVPLPEAQPLSGDSHLAYRTTGVEAHRGRVANVTAIRPAEFAPFWPESSRPDVRTLAYACTLQARPELPLHLSRLPPAVDASQQVTYRIGPARADVQVAATLNVPERDLVCVEWHLRGPPLFRVTRVSGLEVRGWSQVGNRVLVWLERTTGHTRLDLTGRLPLPAAPAGGRHLELPTPRLVPARAQHTRVVLQGTPELRLSLPSPLPANLQPVRRRPGETDIVLRTSAPDFSLSVLVAPATSGTAAPDRAHPGTVAPKPSKPDRPAAGPSGHPGLRVALCELTSAVVGHRRWLHEAVWWLRHEAHGDVAVHFPAPARVVDLAVDGASWTPLQPAPDSLWLPLPGRPGVRRVRVRWLYDAEPLERPRLDAPRLAGAAEGPCAWSVYVPPGWDAVVGGDTAGPGVGPARLAALDLYRAGAELELVRSLAEAGPEDRASRSDARRRFARYCRHASQALRVGADGPGVRGPAGQGLAEWLESLQKTAAILAAKYRFGALPPDAEPEPVPAEAPEGGAAGLGRGPLGQADVSLLTDHGTPLSWFAAAGAAPPRPHLVRTPDADTRAVLGVTVRWLAVLAVIWVVAMLPPLAAWALRLWPELALLAGAWGWHLAGPTVVVLLLLVLGLAGRFFLTSQALHQRRRRRDPSPAASPGGGGS
jgi:hypothetical protein